MADPQKLFKEVWNARETLLRRYEEARRTRERPNMEISCRAAGTRAMVGDLVLVKEVNAVLAREREYIPTSPTSTGQGRGR